MITFRGVIKMLNKKEVYVMYVRILNAATNEFDYLLLKGLDENEKASLLALLEKIAKNSPHKH